MALTDNIFGISVGRANLRSAERHDKHTQTVWPTEFPRCSPSRLEGASITSRIIHQSWTI